MKRLSDSVAFCSEVGSKKDVWDCVNSAVETTTTTKQQRVWLPSVREPPRKGSRGVSTTCSRDASGHSASTGANEGTTLVNPQSSRTFRTRGSTDAVQKSEQARQHSDIEQQQQTQDQRITVETKTRPERRPNRGHSSTGMMGH